MSKCVLIAPLHWGLGHASRCIPIIRDQLNDGNRVIVSANGGALSLLQSIFPNLEYIDIPFMEITYPEDGNMSRHFFWRGPALLQSIWREHFALKTMVKKHGIDIVISDSRFGLWSKKAHSIFITHQVRILSPHFEGIINLLNQWVMNRYDEVWIPDYAESPGLAGALSHPDHIPKHAKYIGPLSRFNEPIQKANEELEAVIIISGPEPQRSLFEAEMALRFIESDAPALMLRGKPHEPSEKIIGNLKIVGHLDDQSLIEALSGCKKVISRSGYSTIMDLDVLKIDAEYIPTPGQTEQEYLATLQTSN